MVDRGERAICDLPEPANEPMPFTLSLGDVWESITASRTRQTTPMVQGEYDYKYGSPAVSSADFTMGDIASCESADEQTTAAPAALKLTHAQAVGRLLFMTWNAGGGARKLPALLDQLGHHVFAIQEAHQHQMLELDNHNRTLHRGQ